MKIQMYREVLFKSKRENNGKRTKTEICPVYHPKTKIFLHFCVCILQPHIIWTWLENGLAEKRQLPVWLAQHLRGLYIMQRSPNFNEKVKLSGDYNHKSLKDFDVWDWENANVKFLLIRKCQCEVSAYIWTLITVKTQVIFMQMKKPVLMIVTLMLYHFKQRTLIIEKTQVIFMQVKKLF